MAGRGSSSGKGSVRTRAPDPWTGKGGFTTLDKDQRVVWEPGLPAMVTARRQHNTRKSSDQPAEETAVVCDLKNTLKMSAEAKVDWLEKALKSISKSQIKAQEVYDIVAHPRFVSGISERAGQKILRMVTDSILVFSDKQRDAFSKSKLFREFAMQPVQRQAESSDEEPAKRRRSRSCSRSRSASSSQPRPAKRRSPSPRASSTQKVQKDRRPTATPQSDSAQELSSSGTADLQGVVREDAKAVEEKLRMEQALKEQEQKREEERKKAEVERKAQLEREKRRKAKLGSAFLVGNEEEEDGPPQMPLISYEKRKLDGTREDKALAEYAARTSQPAASSSAPPEAARFVESMGGGSILQEAHRMLLQKAGGEMRSSPSPRRPSPPPRRKRSRSRSRRNRRPVRSRSHSRTHSRSRSRDTKNQTQTRTSGSSYRSPTPDGRARGQMRAARKAKMIASMLGVQVPRR